MGEFNRPLTIEQEVAFRVADWEQATRSALDPSLTPNERATARLAAAEHVQALTVLLFLRDASAGTARARALGQVSAERELQIGRWGEQHRADDTGGEQLRAEAEQATALCQAAEANIAGGAGWRLVLGEQVAAAFAETDPAALRSKLVQVAAAAVAWIEDLDSRTSQPAEQA